MDRVWQSAPAPALHVRGDAQGLQVRPNDAAAGWAARQGVTDSDWQRLVRERLAPGTADASEVAIGPQGLRMVCRRLALDDGSTLLWLDPGAMLIDERTRLVADAMGVGFWSRDINAGTAYWDEQMYRIHRRAPEEGPPGFDDWIERHVHPHDRAWVGELHRRAAVGWEPVVDTTFRLADVDAGERWVQTWTRRVMRGGHRLAFGMHVDVTAREIARAALERERERTHFAIEAAQVGVWERTLDGSISYWNDVMYRLRGLDPSDPRPPDEIVAATTNPDDHAQLTRAVQRHVETNQPYRYEFRIRRPDGRWRWLTTQGQALRDGDGRVQGMAGVSLDITERKEADALRLQTERAEQASRDKSAFMARLSHELRTPMNAVLGFTRLIDDDPTEVPSERQRGRLQRIAEAGAQMMALIDDLLDLANVEASPPVPAVPVAAAEVLQQAHELLIGLAQRQGVTLRIARLGVAGYARVDRRRLVQALTQLASHAIRQQRAGGWVEFDAWVEPAGAAAAPEGSQALLVVRDGGPGYSEAERASLFEPFVRPGAQARGGEGTGIGLSLAQRLVQAMGGELGAVARAGGGTEFRLRLPAETRVEAAPGAALPLAVLCVEDNPVNLLLVRELLALRPRVTLTEAINGTSAIALALAERPDVLLLDLQLPDIGGIEVMRRLRAEPAMQGSVYVALSANAMPDEIAAARAAGFDDYWTKPIDFNHFLDGIDRLARDAQGASRSRSQASPSSR